MQKEANPLHAYSKYIEKYPWLEGLLLGGGLGAAGYFGSGLLANKMLGGMTANMTPEEKAKSMKRLEEQGTLSTIKRVGGGLGGALGLAYVLNKHMDFSKGLKGATGSMFDPDYKKKNPDFMRRKAEAGKKRISEARYDDPKMMSFRDFKAQKEGSLQKLAFDDPFHKENIPISYAAQVINEDPFLSKSEKGATNMLLEGSEGTGSGLTSGRKLMRSAVQAGVGFGTAYLFGNAAGKVLSLSPDLTKRLSTVGGVAGAIVNTGIFKELRT